MYIVLAGYDAMEGRTRVSQVFETKEEAMKEINARVLRLAPGEAVSLFKHETTFELGDVPKNEVPLVVKDTNKGK